MERRGPFPTLKHCIYCLPSHYLFIYEFVQRITAMNTNQIWVLYLEYACKMREYCNIVATIVSTIQPGGSSLGRKSIPIQSLYDLLLWEYGRTKVVLWPLQQVNVNIIKRFWFCKLSIGKQCNVCVRRLAPVDFMLLISNVCEICL